MNIMVSKTDFVDEKSGRRGRKLLSDLLRDNPGVDPYPEGWFVIDFSKNIKEDKLTSRKFFGEDVVMYRHPQTKEAIVVQAHCPHMGAHLDSYKNGGCLENGVIVCPYHHLKLDPLSRVKGPMSLRRYPTMEYGGFTLALRMRDPDAEPLPPPQIAFPDLNDDDYIFATQSIGIFQGDMMVPLMANSDYMHFQTVHGTSEPYSEQDFRISEDGQECYFEFELPVRNLYKVDEQYPRAGNWRKLRRAFARPSKTRKNLPDTLTHVSAGGYGPSLARSRWWEPQFGIDLLSWLYVSPIDPYTYELFISQAARTIKDFNSRPVQTVLNRLGIEVHMLANHLYVGQEDPPFYNADKIRLFQPALRAKDKLLDGYTTWWKTTFFTQEFQDLVHGYDIDFSHPGPMPEGIRR